MPTIDTEIRDGIAVLTLNRPDKRNALSIELRDLETTKRYLSGNQGFGFEDSFRIEHDDVFDRLLTGAVGPA